MKGNIQLLQENYDVKLAKNLSKGFIRYLCLSFLNLHNLLVLI